MEWSGWGDPAEAPSLSPVALELLRGALGVRRPAPAVAAEDVRLPQVRLDDRLREELSAIVGVEHLRLDDRIRLLHTRGKSTTDLLRIRSGDADDAPDAVIFPGSHEEVLELLHRCGEAHIAVVPFGGGTSVVGGLQPRRDGFSAVVAFDLGRMNRLLELDEESRTATLEPGLRGPDAEALLTDRGYTIGHHPQSFEYASVGGFAAVRSSGQASAGYGRFDERVVALRVATPRGTIETGRAPKSAAGPDLRQLFLGSEGTLGVITAIRIEVRPVPVARVYEGWRFDSFAAGREAVRRLAQDGSLPTVLRLSDEAETAVNLARPGQVGDGGRAGASQLGSNGADAGAGGGVVAFGTGSLDIEASTISANTAGDAGASASSTTSHVVRQGANGGSSASTTMSAGLCANRSRSWERRRWCSATSRTSMRRAPPCTSRSVQPSSTIRWPNGTLPNPRRAMPSSAPAARSPTTMGWASIIASIIFGRSGRRRSRP